ncbi:MAG: hypothetical protein AAFN77_09280 [Planctomycetota bacterium]
MFRTSILSAFLFALVLNLMATAIDDTVNGQEIGFLEDYVLAEDRETALKKLVPGTESYYYYHCLHYQTTRQLENVEKMLPAWKKRFGESSLYQQIRNRQMLLVYPENPNLSLEYIRKRLGLNFNHQRQIPQAQRNLASELDPNLVSTDRLLERALGHSGLEKVSDQGLFLLADSKLSKTQRRQLLQRLTRPDFPNLVDLINNELQERDAKKFSSFRIHQLLTIEQLDQLAAKRPRLKSETGFVYNYLSKLVPSNDVNWMVDREERRQYLERLWAYVEPLQPSFNSLKANVLYQRLQFDAQEEIYDRERFMTYLKLPRNIHYVNPEYIKSIRSRNQIVQLNSDYSQQIRMPAIGSDVELVSQFLQHFFRDAEDHREFEPYVRDSFLREQFAEAKILAGIGDVEKWASMLSPDRYKRLLERVDLDFAPNNPVYLATDEDVSLDMFVKNVDTMIVKIFEINTQNYYRKHRSEIDTDINLDGLVPNFEKTFSYTNPPAIRTRRTFKFPELKNRGVYVVDFIASGKSSRALIRKGKLQVVGSVNAAGHSMFVIDGQNKKAKDATVWVDGQRYQPDDDGNIQIPFSTQPGRTKAIVTQGDFSALHEFNHLSEQYRFTAAMILDRENLTRTNQAKLIIRPSLTVSGATSAPVSLLKDHKLEITTISLDGLPSTRTIDDFEFDGAQETVCEFMIPPRTKTVTAQLRTELRNMSQDKDETFTAQKTYHLNAIDASEQIQDFHLIPTINGYFLEALGKSGELRTNQAVRISFKVNGFTETVYADLQTDENGLINLGNLPNVHTVSIKPSVGNSKNWEIHTQDQAYSRTIHVKQGEPILIPAPAGVMEADPRFISLFESRANRLTRNVFHAVSVVKGLIVIKDLASGDYSLRIDAPVEAAQNRVQHQVTIRVSDGGEVEGVVVDPARHMELGNRQKIQISTLAGNQDKLRIELENATSSTRVHVIASRYQPAYNLFGSMLTAQSIEPWLRRPADLRTVYQEGRKIGDEYDYILRRKYAAKFPGNMLERPSLLLNPWSPKETQNDAQDAAKGDVFAGSGSDSGGQAGRAKGKRVASSDENDFANLDFLGNGSVVLANLKPNKAGVITVDRKDLGENQHIRVVAVKGAQTVQRNINFQLQPLVPEDARLIIALDPKQHYSQSKQTELLAKGEQVKVDDLVSAKFQQYDDLRDVYTLLEALSQNNSTLGTFRFVLEWNNKTDEEKHSLYSEYVCHELNYFIFKKDTQFFKDVVRPHLENKRVKTFMDHYLLGEDLIPFTRPWKFARLNTFEKILLSQRLEDRTDDIVRNLSELYLIAPTSRNDVDRFYDVSITALGLASDEQSVESYRYEREKEMRKKFKSVNELSRAAPKPAYAVPGRQMGGGMGAGVASGGRSSGQRGFAGVMTEGIDAARVLAVESKTAAKDMDSLEAIVSNGKQLNQYRGRIPSSKLGRLMEDEELGEMDADFDDDGIELGVRFQELREQSKRLYRRVDPTREWIENNYYRITPEQQTPDLVRMNQFWRDYANHQAGTFLSSNFAEASHSFTSMMFALSVLDLPLEAADNQLEFADDSLIFKAASPAIVLHQQVRKAKFERQDTKILVSENFFQQNDRYRYEDGVQFDKFVTDEFLAHTLYGGQVVITNPTSTPQQVELLVQIPAGSVASNGSQETRTELLDLKPFSTQTFQYYFYFPTEGDFGHYPAHVASDDEVLAVADGIRFNVVDRQAELDKTSWEFVSQNGTDDEVIDFINNNNIQRIDLSKISFRMKEKAFFKSAIESLRNRYVYNQTLWSYAVKHNDIPAIREFMTFDNSITNNCGIEFDCDLVSILPTERNWYAHKEYWPLVNARAHQLGPQRKILNRSFHTQYQSLLSVLAQHRELTDDDHLAMTYYLLLQDRVEAALDHFSKVSSSKVSNKIQYTYCDAYLDFYRGNPSAAANKAAAYVEYPVDRWRKRFQAIVAQVKEIKSGQSVAIDEEDNLQKQTEMAASSESINLEVTNGEINLTYQNVEQIDVNFYEMDIELLFSRSPFAQDDLDGFSMIRPNSSKTEQLKLDKKGRGSMGIQLPKKMQNKNVLVEVVAGDQSRSAPFFAHSLDVKLIENYGQLQVLDAKTGKPLPKTYVKVYAKTNGGARFHKDGYTDLRGRFDYATQSNRSPDGIQRLSILVLSEDNGAVTRQADMPKE